MLLNSNWIPLLKQASTFCRMEKWAHIKPHLSFQLLERLEESWKGNDSYFLVQGPWTTKIPLFSILVYTSYFRKHRANYMERRG